MKKGFFQIIILGLLSSFSAHAAEIKAINFTQRGEVSELEFLLDEDKVQAHKFHVQEDKQIIIDLKDVTATERVMRAFDTSEFSGAVVFVSAYKKPKTTKDIRVALQLRDNVRSVLKRKNNRIILEIENRYGVFSQGKVEENASTSEKIAALKEDAGRVFIPKSDSVEDILENLVQSGRKKYIGKKITLNFRKVSPVDVLKIIAESSGFNIILSEDVKKLPDLSLNLTDVPWDQALDTILDIGKLVGRKNGMILTIAPYAEVAKEMEEQAKAKAASKLEEPLLTKVFAISFAKLEDLAKILEDYLTKDRGDVQIDQRTNSIVIKDTADVIERVKKIVEVLDTQTPQVLIESKIVEVSETHAKEIGLENGIGFGYDSIGAIPDSGNVGPGFTFSSAPSASRNLFGIQVTRFNRLLNLDFQLRLMESESKAKIVSSPKVVATNKQAAKLTSNEQTWYADSATTEAGDTTVTWKSQEAKLDITVTPTVTNEGSIDMVIALKKDSLGNKVDQTSPQDVTQRTIETKVLVDNGSTVVLGGVYSYSQFESHSGIPFLKDIPLLGWLFRTKYNPRIEKRELIVFLTPRIINQEEAGLVDKGK